MRSEQTHLCTQTLHHSQLFSWNTEMWPHQAVLFQCVKLAISEACCNTQSYASRPRRSFIKISHAPEMGPSESTLLTDKNKASFAHQGLRYSVHLSIHMANCKPHAAVNKVLMTPVIYIRKKKSISSHEKNTPRKPRNFQERH